MASLNLWMCVLLAVAASWCAGESADSGKPVLCASAKPYRGPKLHAPPPTRAFTEAAKPLDGIMESNTVVRLEQAFATARQLTLAPAMTAAVGVPGRGLWSAMSGPASAGGEPARWFWFASVGKAFTAAVTLQLIEERTLRLEDRLSRWFPDFPNAKSITLDHLLTHTSGIYSFQADPEFRVRPDYRAPEELIEIARAHGNGFCPGEFWSYSNTGYVLLGRILERVEGKPFHEILTIRVIKRLGLEQTKALAPTEHLAGLALPNSSQPDPTTEQRVPTTPYAAGNVVATAADMVRFWHALLGGRILQPETVRQQFQRLYPMFENGTFYGRGVMLYDVPDKDGRRLTWLGHSGGSPGTKALVAYSVDSNAFVAVALNNDGSAEATANLLLRALAGTTD